MIPSRSRAARFSTSPKSAAWLTNPPWSRGSPSVCPAWPAGIQLCSPSSRWTASSASRQVGRECDLPVQSRVAAGVDDLHDYIRADVDVVGAALSGGHGAGVAAQGRYRDRASGIGGLPQVGHQRAQGGVADVLARLIRVSIQKRMLHELIFIHTVVVVRGFDAPAGRQDSTTSGPNAASAPVRSCRIGYAGASASAVAGGRTALCRATSAA